MLKSIKKLVELEVIGSQVVLLTRKNTNKALNKRRVFTPKFSNLLFKIIMSKVVVLMIMLGK